MLCLRRLSCNMSGALYLFLLAIIQGLTEFLPVSSSGHLAVGQWLLDFRPAGLDVEIFLHAGTLLAVCLYYWRSIWRIVTAFDWRYVLALVVSTIPAIGLYLCIGKRLEAYTGDMMVVGGCLVWTGLVLTLSRGWKLRNLLRKEVATTASESAQPPDSTDSNLSEQRLVPITLWRASLIGLAQAIAILPGISRSGMTITTARLLKISPSQAAEFSFLMSIPVIGGGTLLHLLEKLRETSDSASLPLAQLLFGALIAGVVGYLAILVVERVLTSGRFWLFGIYCLLLGAGLLILS